MDYKKRNYPHNNVTRHILKNPEDSGNVYEKL